MYACQQNLSTFTVQAVFVCLHAVTSPSLLCSIWSPRPSPLGKELRLLAVGVLLGVEGGQQLIGLLLATTTSQQAWSSFSALLPALITLKDGAQCTGLVILQAVTHFLVNSLYQRMIKNQICQHSANIIFFFRLKSLFQTSDATLAVISQLFSGTSS